MAIKVSQATIDKIKSMGMTKALKSAPKANAEMTEALRRMYGAKRVNAASKSSSKPSRPVMTRTSSSTSTPKSSAPGAISGKSKSSAPRAISGKTSVKMPSAGPAARVSKKNTTSNPVTALHNKLSPYGNKSQTFKSPTGQGLATRKSVPGKPSLGEQFHGIFTGKTKVGSKQTLSSVSATNAKRMGISVSEYNRRLNAAKKK